MAIRDLIRLIQASGNSAAAGQNFLSHVLGAAAGADMVAYELNGWDSWTNSYTGGTLAYGADVTLTFNLNAGAKWTNLRQALQIIANDGSDPTNTGGATITSGGVIVPGSNTLHLSVHGGTKLVQLHRVFNGISKEWNDYPGTEPNPNPYPTPSDININAQFTATGSTTPDAYTFTLHVHYPGDGDFNGPLDYAFNVTAMGNVTTDDTAAAVEWHTNSTYTSLYTTGTQARVTSPDPSTGADNGTLYLRYKDNGAWVNYGAVTWFDKRQYGHF